MSFLRALPGGSAPPLAPEVPNSKQAALVLGAAAPRAVVHVFESEHPYRAGAAMELEVRVQGASGFALGCVPVRMHRLVTESPRAIAGTVLVLQSLFCR